jgi:hypothetical protein
VAVAVGATVVAVGGIVVAEASITDATVFVAATATTCVGRLLLPVVAVATVSVCVAACTTSVGKLLLRVVAVAAASVCVAACTTSCVVAADCRVGVSFWPAPPESDKMIAKATAKASTPTATMATINSFPMSRCMFYPSVSSILVIGSAT